MNVSFHKSLAELYADLCIQARELAIKRESGECICTWCNTVERLHLPDKRCSSSALSQSFNCIEQAAVSRINAALTCIEELKGLLT